MTVLAYESEDNFYPINSNAQITIRDSNNNILFNNYNVIPDDKGYYYLNNDQLDNIYYIAWYDNSYSNEFTFPYNSDVYDYYLLGSIISICNDVTLSTFKPETVYATYFDVDTQKGLAYDYDDLNVYDIDTHYSLGFGFYEKILFDSADNVGIRSIFMTGDKDGSGSKPPDLVMQFGIMAVEKGTSGEVAVSQILSQLQKMESSINSSIGSAAGQVSGSVSDAADQIAGTIEDQYTMSDSEDFGVDQIADQVEEKLGVLTFGADTLRNFLDLFSAENVGGTQLTFPAFQIEVQGVSYNVWQDITFDLSFLEEKFGVLITAVRSVTVLCVWLAVLGYLVKAKDHFINNKG